MQRQEVITLPVSPKVLTSVFGRILDLARGGRVLNVGASGGVEHYLPGNQHDWLHDKLHEAASDLVGIDIDKESIAYAANHGIKIIYGDCETYQFEQPFDLIVMSDVIEHVNAAVPAIGNLAKQLSPNGRLVITTPNITHYGLVLKAWFGGQTSVYYDHTAGFLPEHFQVIGNRLGLQLTEIYFFSHHDTRSLGMSLKSNIARFLGAIMPRSHNSFMVVMTSGAKK